jgi:Trk K+ transport system NAD-binding subunit
MSTDSPPSTGVSHVNQRTDGAAPRARPPRRRVIVAGFGPVGRTVADRLRDAGVAVSVIEMNPRTVERQRQLGLEMHLGDATDPAVLAAAGVAGADALILTIPQEQQVLAACEAARSLCPDIFIAARTNHLSMGMQCRAKGADHIVVEELVTAEAMRAAVMDRLLAADNQ